MKTKLILFYCFLGLNSISRSNGATNLQCRVNKFSISTNTTKIVFFSSNKTREDKFRNSQASILSKTEIDLVEKILNTCVNQFNRQESKFLKLKGPVIKISGYSRQYVVALTKNGDKQVWVNCFCNEQDDKWRKQIVFVFDGGPYYFNLKINVTTRKWYELIVNGQG